MILDRKLLRPGQVSTHLPREARAALRAAYETEPHLPREGSRARREVVDRVTAEVKAAHPSYFYTAEEAKVREDAFQKVVEARMAAEEARLKEMRANAL